MPRDLSYLLDILHSAQLILKFVEGLNQKTFDNDVKTQYAVVRGIEIIGEATKRLSPAFRDQYPHVPWKSMAGMRDVLIHDYDEVDLVEVWKVVQNDIPKLIAQIEPLVPPDDEQNE